MLFVVLVVVEQFSKSMIASNGENNVIEMESNCFIDNSVVGIGVVVIYSPPSLVTLSNNVVTPVDGSLVCDFIAFISRREGGREGLRP